MINQWANLKQLDIDLLSQEFQTADPFQHVVIDNFFNEHLLNNVLEEMDNDTFETWDKRDHADVQVKWRSNWQQDEDIPPVTYSLIQYLNSGNFLRFLSRLTGLTGLIADPYLTGGGYNQTNRDGLLAIHADGNWHDLMGVHRRLNIIVYLNPHWQEEWNGNLELWSKTSDNKPNKCEKSIPPMFNRLCIFRTDDFSFHGQPKALTCPQDKCRRSLILYYYTNTRPENEVVSLYNKHRAIFYNGNDKI
jgi:Rps23 Pro-64 3,4-dihydroxylase Tpa1-like proline 4-hydroxylase